MKSPPVIGRTSDKYRDPAQPDAGFSSGFPALHSGELGRSVGGREMLKPCPFLHSLQSSHNTDYRQDACL